MNIIARTLILLVLLLVWACCGEQLVAAGLWLNAQAGADWPSLVLAVGVALLCLLLLVPLLVSLWRALFGSTPLRFRHMLVWGGILLLLCVGADVVDKGLALNSLTHYPLLGYIFWGLIACFLYWQVVAPIVCFCRLTTLRFADDASRVALAMRYLRRWRSAARAAGREDCDKFGELYAGLHNARSAGDAESMKVLLAEFAAQDELLPARSRELIRNYCQIAALAVVVSRNRWLDGAALLFLQLRLVVSLAQLHGGKPSPVFNALCMGAVVANSFVYVVINGLLYGDGGMMVTELVDDIADLLVDDPEVQYKAGNSASHILPIVGKAFSGVVDVLARPTLEAALAASNVYVCGHLFLRRLQGEARLPGFKEVIALRRKGRVEIFRGVAEALKDKCCEKFGFGRETADSEPVSQSASNAAPLPRV